MRVSCCLLSNFDDGNEESMKKIIIGILCFLFLAGCAKPEEGILNKTEDETIEMQSKEAEGDASIEAAVEWDEKTVIIPELQNDYEVWFIADSHVIIPDENATKEVLDYAAERAPVFLNEKGVDSAQIFSQVIKEANEKQPDLVLFGGDIIDFPSDANIAYLKEELAGLSVPYLFVMGNHDWTYPWEYMTPQGVQKYRPLIEEITGIDSYVGMKEFKDVVFLGVDNSSNQLAPEAVSGIEQAYKTGKPIVLVQHVPFSSENLIVRAKQDWASPVTLGMQVHGGIPVNAISDALYKEVLDDESQIRVVLSGHVHFAYEEQIAEMTTEIITDAAYKGKAVKLFFSGEKNQHDYFCDKFMLTVDEKRYDLTLIEPELSSVSALQLISNNQLFILGRIDESCNMLLVYDFEKDEFVFHEQGITMCWIQDEYESARYLKEDVVYDLAGNVIYQPDSAHTVNMIEYVDREFMVTIADLEHQNPEQVWVE